MNESEQNFLVKFIKILVEVTRISDWYNIFSNLLKFLFFSKYQLEFWLSELEFK